MYICECGYIQTDCSFTEPTKSATAESIASRACSFTNGIYGVIIYHLCLPATSAPFCLTGFVTTCLISRYRVPSRCSPSDAQFVQNIGLEVWFHPNIDLQNHLIPTQNPTTVNTTAATMTAIILPWFSNASLTSNRVIFLIFLFRCQVLLFPLLFRSFVAFASPEPSSCPSLGAMASLGSKCPVAPRRPHVESC